MVQNVNFVMLAMYLSCLFHVLIHFKIFIHAINLKANNTMQAFNVSIRHNYEVSFVLSTTFFFYIIRNVPKH